MTNALKPDLSLEALGFDDPATGDDLALGRTEGAGVRAPGALADVVGLALGWDLWQCGYRMTHADVQVEHPNAPGVLRTMTWQDLDHAPDFPVLTAFLNDWMAHRDERVVAIRVVTVHDLTPDRLGLHGISVARH